MPDAYYPPSGDEEAMPDGAAPATEGNDNPPKEGEDEQMEGETALLPKTILAGKEFKPGDEVVLKVVHLYDDEVEVAYATGKDEDENDNTKKDWPEMAGAMDKIGAMAGSGEDES
jgi:hypothetical protein